MEMSEWFAKRDRLAEKFQCPPKDVPAEAVWLLSEDALTPKTIPGVKEMALRVRNRPSQRVA